MLVLKIPSLESASVAANAIRAIHISLLCDFTPHTRSKYHPITHVRQALMRVELRRLRIAAALLALNKPAAAGRVLKLVKAAAALWKSRGKVEVGGITPFQEDSQHCHRDASAARA